MLKLIQKIKNENDYSGSDWNHENTTKYILFSSGKKIEAGFFLHYISTRNNQRLKKAVIELPSSYGCPIKCSFCASSCIKDTQILSFEEIFEIFLFIYSDQRHQLNDVPLLISMTGIGDYSLNYENINQAICKIRDIKPDAWFTVSSCIWNAVSFQAACHLSVSTNVRAVNVTFVSMIEPIVRQLIVYYKSHVYDFETVVGLIKSSTLENIRINYLMIKGINDGIEDYKKFADTIQCIKEKVTIRISKLNRTLSSETAGLYAPDLRCLTSCQQYLEQRGFSAYTFYSMNDDQMNCGQLITEGAFHKV